MYRTSEYVQYFIFLPCSQIDPMLKTDFFVTLYSIFNFLSFSLISLITFLTNFTDELFHSPSISLILMFFGDFCLIVFSSVNTYNFFKFTFNLYLFPFFRTVCVCQIGIPVYIISTTYLREYSTRHFQGVLIKI